MLKREDWLLDPRGAPGLESSKLVSRVDAPPYRHHTETLTIRTPKRYALVNLTPAIGEIVERSGIKDGFCFVSAMHITAGIYINDAESGLLSDISEWLEGLAPYDVEKYRHHQTGEDNADAHLKSFLTHHAVTCPITEGALHFGTWQQIFYGEYDGMRKKRILVKATGLIES